MISVVNNKKLIDRIEEYLNIIHYCINTVDFKFDTLLDKIFPFRLMYRLPIFKKRQEKLGLDFEEEFQKIRRDKRLGTSVMYAGGYSGCLLGVFLMSIFKILGIEITYIFTIFCIILSGFTIYFLIQKEDKYIAYFEKYDKWSLSERRKYQWKTFFVVIFVIFLFFISLIVFYNKSIWNIFN